MNSDPPLEESDIPSGEWLCHTCKCNKINQPQTRNKRSASNSSSSSTKSSKKAKTTSMDLLIQAASTLNPKQFELPYYMHEPCNFPGTDKSMYYIIAFAIILMIHLQLNCHIQKISLNATLKVKK